jgi:hypothetical protein
MNKHVKTTYGKPVLKTYGALRQVTQGQGTKGGDGASGMGAQATASSLMSGK